MKVTIEAITFKSDYWPKREETRILVDGNLIGQGFYGGEPEDNLKSRDYNWVEPLFKKLAESLGAAVEIKKIVKKYEEEIDEKDL